MKRKILSLILLFICIFSWYSVLSEQKSEKLQIKEYLNEAETLFEKKIYDDAETKYKEVLKIDPNNKEALFGLANINYQTDEPDVACEYLEKLLKITPKDEETAILYSKCLVSGGKYSKSIEILSQMEQTEQIKAEILSIKSMYSLGYKNVKLCHNWSIASDDPAYCTVQEGEYYAVYSSQGKKISKGNLSYIGHVSEDGKTYPAISENTWCYVDSSGNRKLVPDKTYSYLGPFFNGLAVAKYEDKFGYVDENFNEYHFEYEKAYNFKDGEATVVKDGKVLIINSDFSVKAETDFTDVKADDYGFTNHFGKSVFKNGEKWYFCTSSGAKVGNVECDNLCLPQESGGLVAFEKDGKFGFLNFETGDIEIAPEYDDALSASNGLISVKVGDKWGYIDENNTKITEFIFDFAGSVSKDGTAFVSNEAGFALLTFYFLAK